MSTNLTIHFPDDSHDDLKVKVNTDVTIREWRAAVDDADTGAMQELILNAVESVEGYETVDDLPTTVLHELVTAVGKVLRGENQTHGTSATRSERRAAAKRERQDRKRNRTG